MEQKNRNIERSLTCIVYSFIFFSLVKMGTLAVHDGTRRVRGDPISDFLDGEFRRLSRKELQYRSVL